MVRQRGTGSVPRHLYTLVTDLEPKLHPTRIGNRAACLPEIHVRRVAGVIAPEILGVQNVEPVDSQPESRPPEQEILAESEVKHLVSRRVEAAGQERIAGSAETVADVDVGATADGSDAAEKDVQQ